MASPAVASARQRVVVLPFAGKQAGAAQRAIRDALRGRAEVETVAASSMFSAAKRLGYSRRDLRDGVTLSLVAAEVQVDAIVKGHITSKGRTAYLHLKVFNGGDGGSLGGHKVRLRRGRADKATARAAGRRLMSFIRRGRWQPTGEDEDDPDEGRRADGRDDWRPPRTPVDRFEGSSSERLGASEADLVGLAPAPDERVHAAEAQGPGAADLRLSAGVASLSRSYELLGGVNERQESTTVRYDTGYFAGFHLHAEIFPFALAEPAAGTGAMGLEAYVDRATTTSSSKRLDAQGTPTLVDDIETTQLIWGLSAVYRLFPLETNHGPVSVRLMAGWHAIRFALDHGASLFQSIDYGGGRLGGDVWIPIAAADDMVLSLRGRVAALWAQSNLNDRVSYPASSGLGLEAAGGLDADLGGAWALAADYRLYSLRIDFPQAGVDRPALESDDLYHGVVLELGYRP